VSEEALARGNRDGLLRSVSKRRWVQLLMEAGYASTQLIHRLATQGVAAYRPVAILDDDASKWRLQIQGVPDVLGRRGPVLTALSAQIGAGGPITVTDPDVSRHFMLANEAVHLVLQAAAISQGGEVLVLDMGEPVRISDIARWLAASTGRDPEVFTGLRPGEKLTEERVGHAETDHRPYHPLICQVPVQGLDPGEVTTLDPDADLGSPRQIRARRACGPSYDGTMTVPLRERVKSVAQRLGMRFSMRPAMLGQPHHQMVEETGGIRIGAERSARRICHVVVEGITKQRRALASRMNTRQPAGQRLAGRSRSDLLAAPDEFLQRERTRPRPGLGDNGMPEIFPGHRQHQAGGRQVGRADDAAAVRGDLDSVRGHDRDDFLVRRVSAADHPGRPHWHGHAECGQLPGQQRSRHRRPAYVRGAQHDNAGLTGIGHGRIVEKYFSPTFAK
jgi:hypothetical protein